MLVKARPENWVTNEIIGELRDQGHILHHKGSGRYNGVNFYDWKDVTTEIKYRVFEADEFPDVIERENIKEFVFQGRV